MISFIPIPHMLDGQPAAWGAAVFPWSFIITQIGETRYAASAMDSRMLNGMIEKVRLGNNFGTFEDASTACITFLDQWRGDA